MRKIQHHLPIILLFGLFHVQVGLYGQPVSIERKIEADSLAVYVANNSHMPFYVQVEVNENIPADSRMHSDFVLPALGGSAKILAIPVIDPIDTTQLLQEHFGKIHLKDGNPLAVRPDANFPYSLPFQRGKSYRLIQGFGGKFSHR